MLQNFSDMQIIGLIILATIIFIFIRRTYRNYRISKAIKVCHGPVQQLEELANSNDPVEIAELPKKGNYRNNSNGAYYCRDYTR